MLEINKLPPELRDRIYEIALVRDVISVAPTELQKCDIFSRSTWQDATDTTITRPGGVRARVYGKPVTYSYHLEATNEDSPNLNIFHASRQVYAECWPIIYKQNMFDFSNAETTVTAASMCLAFLKDRPQQALQHIRRMHLMFGDSLYSHVGWSIPTPPKWGQLCIENSTVLSLHQLVLSVNERYPKAWIQTKFWIHTPPPDPGNVGLQPWVEDVYRITNLRKLEVDVTSDEVFLDRLELINYLRDRMLAKDSELQKINELLYAKKVVGGRSWAVVSNYVLPKKYSADGALVPHPYKKTGVSLNRLADSLAVAE